MPTDQELLKLAGEATEKLTGIQTTCPILHETFQQAAQVITALIERLQAAEADARRYRRLRILGAKVDAGDDTRRRLLRFQNLDDVLDADLKTHPSRGEFAPSQAGGKLP